MMTISTEPLSLLQPVLAEDVSRTGERWPPYPYLGLEFYREHDTALFRERDDEIRECSNLLVGFGVKYLLLHGPSGCGKSSFLRAGLLPALKRNSRFLPHFLNYHEDVIRCTADPLRELARALRSALDEPNVLADSDTLLKFDHDANLVPDQVKKELRKELTLALEKGHKSLQAAVITSLGSLCAELPGKLVIVLDQAEEVLTRALSKGDPLSDARSFFFRFLENIFIDNIDIRLILTLRTEYYGRFREELRISDDRLAGRPAAGGIQPFLLRALRDRDTLIRIVETPSLALKANGERVYDFTFEEGAVARIVDDLLEAFPASVTPALQVVCASLFAGLNGANRRMITLSQYQKLGGVTGIVRSYVERGILAICPKNTKAFIKWHLLLHSLVSPQGGGTVVSMTEPFTVLKNRARDLGISEDISRLLAKLMGGWHPLLRGEPIEAPRHFSLKHDVLAVILSRWYDEYSGGLKARDAERRKWYIIMGIAAMIILITMLSSTFILLDKERDAAIETKSFELKENFAAHSNVSNFRRSLMLLLYSLRETAEPKTTYDWLRGFSQHNHELALGNLRQIIPRVPWFGGTFNAAGVDVTSGSVVLLQGLSVQVLRLSNEKATEPNPIPTKEFILPSSVILKPPYAAGFVSGLGPVVFTNGKIYFRSVDKEDVQVRDLWQQLFAKLPEFFQGFRPFVDFAGGELRITKFDTDNDNGVLKIVRLTAEDLQGNPIRLPDRSRPMRFEQQIGKSIIFSDSSALPSRYGALGEVRRSRSDQGGTSRDAMEPDDPGTLAELDAYFGVLANADQELPERVAIADLPRETDLPKRQYASLAFASNQDAIAVKRDGHDFDIFEIGGALGKQPSRHHVTVPEEIPSELAQSGVSWLLPPLAAVKIGQHWRVAWLGRGGIWVVQSSDKNPSEAILLPGAPLLGEPLRGSKLKFVASGDFLLLTEQQQFDQEVRMWVWDLRPGWEMWSTDPQISEAQLESFACKTVLADGRGGAFEDDDAHLFQLSAEGLEPCPLTRSRLDE